MNRQKMVLIGMLLLATVLPGFAQQAETVVFKFSARSNMFYLHGNETELERLYNFIDLHRAEIVDGRLPVRVDGYCASFDNRAENLKTAAVRSNRVKSMLIIKKDLKEENFLTANHANAYTGEKDVVVVSFITKEAKAAEQPKPAPQPETKPAVTEQPKQEPPHQPEKQQSVKEAQAASQPVKQVISNADFAKFSLRTNLLYWAVATPNLGIEYRPSENFGILVNGAYSHWIWSGEGKHHRTWLVQPEIRWYLGESKHWFLGIEGHAAEFNFKFGDTGYQGEAIGGGLTGGYRLHLSRVLDMDFSLGLGYTSLKYEEYYRSNGVFVLKESGIKKNVFAPTQAGVSLIFKL